MRLSGPTKCPAVIASAARDHSRISSRRLLRLSSTRSKAAKCRRSWAAVAIPALIVTLNVALKDQGDSYQHNALTAGSYVHLRAEPNQTAYVLNARVNALYYTGLPSPFPYHWTLMKEAIPGFQAKLRLLLGSSRRPTWIIDWDGAQGLRLQRSYRVVAHVCGRPILLRRGAPAKPPPQMAGSCQIA